MSKARQNLRRRLNAMAKSEETLMAAGNAFRRLGERLTSITRGYFMAPARVDARLARIQEMSDMRARAMQEDESCA